MFVLVLIIRINYSEDLLNNLSGSRIIETREQERKENYFIIRLPSHGNKRDVTFNIHFFSSFYCNSFCVNHDQGFYTIFNRCFLFSLFNSWVIVIM